jgi:hypothetical protein
MDIKNNNIYKIYENINIENINILYTNKNTLILNIGNKIIMYKN